MRKIETYNDKKKAFCCPHCGSKIDFDAFYSPLWDMPKRVTEETEDTCDVCGETFYWVMGIVKDKK